MDMRFIPMQLPPSGRIYDNGFREEKEAEKTYYCFYYMDACGSNGHRSLGGGPGKACD